MNIKNLIQKILGKSQNKIHKHEFVEYDWNVTNITADNWYANYNSYLVCKCGEKRKETVRALV